LAFSILKALLQKAAARSFDAIYRLASDDTGFISGHELSQTSKPNGGLYCMKHQPLAFSASPQYYDN
jgi:hypothetical protein